MHSAASAALLAVALQGVHERRQDARAGRADRMAERAGAAVDVDLLVRDADVLHRRHGDDREGLVDLEQIHVGGLPAGALASTVWIAPTGAMVNHSGSCAWLACATMRAMGLRPGRAAALARASTRAAAPSAMDEELAAVTVPSLPKAGFRVGIFSTDTVNGVSSRSTTRSPLRSVTVTGAISAVEGAGFDRGQRAAHGLGGKRILVGAREAILRGSRIGEAAHELAVPGALQAVVEHVVEDFAVPQAIAGTGLEQQVGRVRHRLEPAGEHEIGAAGGDLVGAVHDGAHAGPAHLVDGRGRHRTSARRRRAPPGGRAPGPGRPAARSP